MGLGFFGMLSEGGVNRPGKNADLHPPPGREFRTKGKKGVPHEREKRKRHFWCLKLNLWGLIVGFKRLIAKKTGFFKGFFVPELDFFSER